MDQQKTFDVIKHYIKSSFLESHFTMCRELAYEHFQDRIKDDTRYAELMLLIQDREAIPTHDCGAHDQPDYGVSINDNMR